MSKEIEVTVATSLGELAMKVAEASGSSPFEVLSAMGASGSSVASMENILDAVIELATTDKRILIYCALALKKTKGCQCPPCQLASFALKVVRDGMSREQATAELEVAVHAALKADEDQKGYQSFDA